MAAAQASRLGLRALIDALCTFAWSRLSQCGGREVAELVSAAVKHGCGDDKFFHFVGAFCRDRPSAFGSLRDVALLASALMKRADPASAAGPRLDRASALHGLAVAAMPHLRRAAAGDAQPCVRDASEFLYAVAHVLDRRWADSGEPLHRSPAVSEAISASVALARRCLHRACPQTISKLAGAVAAAWAPMSWLRVSTLQPFIADLAQAVRFRHPDFNAKDVASIVVAFAKLDVVDDVVAEVMPEQVEARASEFLDKDLCLLLWACSRHGYVGKRCAEAAVREFQRRDLSRMAVVDVCMASQALAKLGPSAKAALCLVAGEAFSRQLHGFSTRDKALLMWSLAKSRVVHLALCRLLIHGLSAECSGKLPRDVASATLWATAVVCPSLPAGEESSRKLVQDLCAAQPWVGASPFEVANAAWAFGQVPLQWVGGYWSALMTSAEKLSPGGLALHELCNLLSGLALCPTDVRGSPQLLEQVLGEVVARVRNGARVSMHDRRSLRRMLSIRSEGGGWTRLLGLEELEALLSGQPSGAGGAPAGGAAEAEAAALVAVPVVSVASVVAAAPRQEADGEAARTPHPAAAAPRASAAGGAADVAPPGDSCSGGVGPQQARSCATDGPGPAGGRGPASPQRVRAKSPVWRVFPEGCPWLDEEGVEDLRSPDLTPRYHHQVDNARMTCRNVTCCPSVDGSNLVVGDSAMQVNSHCDYPGHCVQLRNTFIHVECTAAEDEDCAICGIRQRARSADTLEFRATTAPGQSPALRPRLHPGAASSAGTCAVGDLPLAATKRSASRTSAGGPPSDSAGSEGIDSGSGSTRGRHSLGCQ